MNTEPGTTCEETIVWSVDQYVRFQNSFSDYDPDDTFLGISNTFLAMNPIFVECWSAGVEAEMLVQDYTKYYT